MTLVLSLLALAFLVCLVVVLADSRPSAFLCCAFYFLFGACGLAAASLAVIPHPTKEQCQ